MSKEVKKVLPVRSTSKETVLCARCGKPMVTTGYSVLCWFILRHKPVCSLECNKALGQVK